MAENENLIDTVIRKTADEQVIGLTELLGKLDIQMAADIKTANQLNSALANTKTFSDYSKGAANAALQLEKIQQAQNKTQASTVKLEEVQAKSAAAQKLRDEQAAQRLAQQQAKQAAANAKEIAAAEAKAAKLAEIAEASARKRNVQFPESQTPFNPVTADDSPAVRYEPIITGNENMAASAVKSTEAIAAENAALLEQQEVLGSLTVAQRANIEALLALQAERAANVAELKALNVEDAASGERAVFLTAEQVRLKIAISQVTVELNRQTKEALAADGAMTKLDQSVLLLRTAYEQLSVAERESMQGQAMLAELTALDVENKKLALTVGNTSKNIGNYTTATAIADKLSAQFVRQLVRMSVEFLLVTVAFGAIQWLYEWIKNLDIFTGRLDKARQAWMAWSDVMKEANKNAAEQVVKLEVLNKAATDVNLSEKQRLDAAEKMKELWPDKLKNLSDEAIMNGTVKTSIDELTESIEKQALAEAGLTKLTDIANKELDLRTQSDKLNYNRAYQVRVENQQKAYEMSLAPTANANSDAIKRQPLSADQIKKQLDGRTNRENDIQQADIKAQLAVLENTKKIIEDNIGIDGLAKAAEKGGAKPSTSISDKANEELFESYRKQLEEAKKQSKLIADDETNSYQTRLQALNVYETAAKAIVNNADAAIERDTKISAQKRKNLKQGFDNELLGIEHDTAEDRIKIQKEALAKIIEQTSEGQEDELYILQRGANQALEALTKAKDDKINALSLERAQGKISEQKYNEDILAINDAYNIQRIQQEINTQAAILGIKEANRDATVLKMQADGANPEDIAKYVKGANKGIGQTEDTITGLKNNLSNAIAKQGIDQNSSSDKDGKLAKENAEKALEATIKNGIDEVDKLRQKAYEAEIDRLERLGDQIDLNAENEKKQVQDSIASSATKARETAVIEAKAAAQHQTLQAKINKEKHKEDVAEKEATIAKIIIEGALAIVKSLGNPFVVALTSAAVAFELATAIATPLPTYAKGTKNYPGGLGIWGEAGIERATLPDGSVQYSNGASIANFPKGTIITPHTDLMRQIRPEPVKFAGGEQVGWGDILKQLKKMETKPSRNLIRVNIGNGFEQYKRNYLSK